MTALRQALPIAIGLVGLTLASVVAQDTHHTEDAGGADPAIQAYRAAAERMHRDMTIELSGNPDVDFARGMIPHHQGAIDMARVVLEHGQDPELKKLAQDIIAAQEREIAVLRSWLEKRGETGG